MPPKKAAVSVSAKSADRIYQAFKRQISKKGLINPGDHVLLAFSGGPDSTCLLALLNRLRQEVSFTLSLAHLNHGLRAAAFKDEALVREMARRFGLPLVIKRVDVRRYARQRRLNLEEAGRELRYSFLEETSQRLGANKIATAHTMDDQAETFLLRLLRGAGPQGLSGVFPVVEGKIIRPLLGIERRQVEAYLQAQNLPFALDESNLDRRYRRNRIRLEMIPYLKKKFEPQLVRRLATTAEILREEEAYWAAVEDETASRVIKSFDRGYLLDTQALSLLHPALARRLIRRFLRLVRSSGREANFGEVEAIRSLEPGKEIHLRRRVKLVRLGPYILEKSLLLEHRHYQISWDGERVVELPFLGLRFHGRLVGGAEVPSFNDQKFACLRADLLRFPLEIRPREPGDKYHPAGAAGPRKLKEIMRARHIPPFLRPFWPVFLSAGRIVWVPGCPVAEEFKVQPETEKVYIIELL